MSTLPPKRMRRYRAWLLIGGIAALVVIVIVIATPPLHPELRDAEGGVVIAIDDLVRQGRLVQAAARLEAEAARTGWTPPALRRAGDMWRAVGEPEQAFAYWTAAYQAGENDPVFGRELAAVAIALEEWVTAEQALSAVIAHPATDASARLWALFQRGLLRLPANPSAALIDLRAAAAEPAFSQSAAEVIALLDLQITDSFQIAAALDAAALPRTASLVLETALSRDLDGDTAARLLAYAGLLRARAGRTGTAYLQAALAQAPADARVQFVTGLYWRQLGDLSASLAAFQASAALDPTDPAVYAELGRAYAALDDLDLAVYWLTVAVGFAPDTSPFQAELDRVTEQRQQQLIALGLLTATDVSPEPP